MKRIVERLKSPVVWFAVLGLVYSTVLVPGIPTLPEWSAVAGYFAAIFGIVNNPADRSGF